MAVFRCSSDKIREKAFKLIQDRFGLDIQKEFFTVGVVRCWNKLPGEAGDALSLEMFKDRCDGALSNLV